jgi:hypothetical protein
LIEHLPEGQRSDDQLESTLRSPQFRQSLRSLSHALQSDNFNSIMANLSINPEAGMSHMVGTTTSLCLSFSFSLIKQYKCSFPPLILMLVRFFYSFSPTVVY